MGNFNISDIITCIVEGVAALGSVLVALTAIWGRSIKRIFYKAELSLEINQDDNCCVDMIEVESNESNTERELQIRIKLINKGNETALDTISFVDEVYKQDGDGKFSQYRNYLPFQLMYYQTGKTKDHVIPHLSYYIEIAKVMCLQVNAMSEDSATSKQNHKLYLQAFDKIPFSRKELGKGTFIVPVKTYFKCAKEPVVTYIWLYWDGDNLTGNYKSKLVAQIKTAKEFKNLIK